jgi:hypothetical protein
LGKTPLLARRPFGFDQSAYPILETQLGVRRGPALLVEGVGHRREM